MIWWRFYITFRNWRRSCRFRTLLFRSPRGRKHKNKIKSSYLLTFRLRMDLQTSKSADWTRNSAFWHWTRISETKIRNSASWIRKIKNRRPESGNRNLRFGKSKIGKSNSGSKNYENRNFGKGKIRNRNSRLEIWKQIFGKTNENLRNRQKVTHEKNYFQKDDQTGYKSRKIIFKTYPNPR